VVVEVAVNGGVEQREDPAAHYCHPKTGKSKHTTDCLPTASGSTSVAMYKQAILLGMVVVSGRFC